jgi:uncharacterized membrane protein YkoI
MKRFLLTIPACVLSLMLIFPASVSGEDISAEQARMLKKQGDILSLESIIDAALTIKPGQILETELDADDGRYIYELEILDDRGRVWELEFDAANGELIELENED